MLAKKTDSAVNNHLSGLSVNTPCSKSFLPLPGASSAGLTSAFRTIWTGRNPKTLWNPASRSRWSRIEVQQICDDGSFSKCLEMRMRGPAAGFRRSTLIPKSSFVGGEVSRSKSVSAAVSSATIRSATPACERTCPSSSATAFFTCQAAKSAWGRHPCWRWGIGSIREPFRCHATKTVERISAGPFADSSRFCG